MSSDRSPTRALIAEFTKTPVERQDSPPKDHVIIVKELRDSSWADVSLLCTLPRISRLIVIVVGTSRHIGRLRHVQPSFSFLRQVHRSSIRWAGTADRMDAAAHTPTGDPRPSVGSHVLRLVRLRQRVETAPTHPRRRYRRGAAELVSQLLQKTVPIGTSCNSCNDCSLAFGTAWGFRVGEAVGGILDPDHQPQSQPDMVASLRRFIERTADDLDVFTP